MDDDEHLRFAMRSSSKEIASRIRIRMRRLLSFPVLEMKHMCFKFQNGMIEIAQV
jgi:hypothetical protein